MWDAISDALDEQTTRAAEKLRAFEAAPAPQLWQVIASEIDAAEDAPSRTIPFYKRYTTALRYAGAAAILVLVALTITYLVYNSSDSRKVARQPSVSVPTGKAPQPASGEVTVRQTEDPDRVPEHRQKSKQEINTDRRTATATGDKPSVASANPRPAPGRYMTVATETGKPVRLSRKVYPVFDCAEHSAAFERFQCQENIEALQKMASSLASPSGDFASLIDMIKTLEENR